MPKEREFIIRFLYEEADGWYKDVYSVMSVNKEKAKHKFYEIYGRAGIIITEIEKI